MGWGGGRWEWVGGGGVGLGGRRKSELLSKYFEVEVLK